MIPGHENVGVIEEIGDEARERLEFYGRPLAPGDRIVMCPDVVCGRCWYCRHGRMLWCENVVCYGVTLGCERAPHLFGGWAEHMVLRSDAFVYKVPDGLAPELAVRPLVGARFPLERAGDALRLLDGRGATGKVVLTL